LTNKLTLIVEIKGQPHGDTDAKHQAARRWVTAVNNWGKLGRWDFLVCRDPQKLGKMLDTIETAVPDPFLEVIGCLTGEPLIPAEIDRELYGGGSK